MQITPPGGAAGLGVSEAKLTPTPGQTAPVTSALVDQLALSIPAPAPAPSPVLADTAVIREVAVADLVKLTQILQPAPPPERVTKVEQLVQEIVHAIREDRREWAVGRFVEAVTTDPAKVEELRANPDLEPIRHNVDVLMNRLTNVAKMDAETKLGTVEQTLESANWPKLPHWETATHSLVQIGHRLMEAGGYVNYVRTAELATTLQTAYWSSNIVDPSRPVIGAGPLKKEETKVRRKGAKEASFALAYHAWDSLREKLPPRVQALWERAPLLAILGAWFTVGFAAGALSYVAKAIWPDSWIVEASDFGFQLWGVGFLAIVGFGFWARVRRPRRRI